MLDLLRVSNFSCYNITVSPTYPRAIVFIDVIKLKCGRIFVFAQFVFTLRYFE